MPAERSDFNIIALLDEVTVPEELGSQSSAWGPAYADNPINRSDREIDVIQRVLSKRTSLIVRSAESEENEEEDFIPGEALQEALEAAYLYAPVAQAEGAKRKQTLEKPLNAELALEGLNWLIPHLDKSSLLRRASARARTAMRIVRDEELAAQQAVDVRAQAMPQPSSTEEQQQAREDARQQAQVERHQAFQATVHQLRENSPQLDFESLAELSEHLRLHEEVSGLVIRENRGFQPTVTKHVGMYLAAPGKLVNDLQVMLLASNEAILANPGDPTTKDQTALYIEKMFSAVSHALLISSYPLKDLTAEAVAEWLDLAKTDQADMTSDAAGEIQKFCQKDIKDFLTSDLALLYGRRILAQSLQRGATKPAKRFVDSLYMVADQGFDPLNGPKLRTTYGLLMWCFSAAPQAKGLLYEAMNDSSARTRRQAIDFHITLGKLSKVQAIAGSGQATNKGLSFGPLLDKQSTDFWRYVNTPSGQAQTLFGRFSEYYERPEDSAVILASHQRRRPWQALGKLGKLRPKRS